MASAPLGAGPNGGTMLRLLPKANGEVKSEMNVPRCGQEGLLLARPVSSSESWPF